MRKSFVEMLIELMGQDERVVLILGDVGFSFLEPIFEKFPKQIINIGIMEQLMMGYATGRAIEGAKPFVYTMSNFILLRALEQTRNDVVWGNADILMCGTKGSAAYKFLGKSHNMSEREERDILENLKELQPNFNYYFPQTEEETKDIIRKEYARQGPAYI